MKIKLAWEILSARLLGRRKPLIVAWSVTNKCNRRCAYCESPFIEGKELSKEEGFALIDQIAESGGKVVSFTGGEPLIHPHIDDYIARVHSKGMRCGINSNGVLVRKKIDVLKDIGFIKLSLDGEPGLHDEIRGDVCAEFVFDALEACKERNISATILAVLSSKNLDQVPYLVSIAEKYDVSVFFQPATDHKLKAADENPIVANPDKYRACIDEIVRTKKGPKGKFIGNSFRGLRHLRRWPEDTRMPCEGLRVSCRIEPDGKVYHCGRMIRFMDGYDALELGFAEAFRKLEDPYCSFCWCAHRVETNLILGFNPGAVLEAVRSKLL